MKSFQEFCINCPQRKIIGQDPRGLCGLSRVQEFFTFECSEEKCVGYYAYKLAYKEFKEKIEDRWEALDDPGHS